jgi:hypothetical protein
LPIKDCGRRGEKYFEAAAIVRLSHARGVDELVHRSLKELATENNCPSRLLK